MNSDKKNKRCFFIGHRDAPSYCLSLLEQAVKNCILTENITQFIVGNYSNFDHMAASAVRNIKKAYPQVTLYLLIPYHPAIRPVALPEGFDGTLFPDGMEAVPPRYAIDRANKAIIDSSDYLICYAAHPGHAYNLVEYAKRRGVPIDNLSKQASYLQAALREAARREFAEIPEESELHWQFSAEFQENMENLIRTVFGEPPHDPEA